METLNVAKLVGIFLYYAVGILLYSAGLFGTAVVEIRPDPNTSAVEQRREVGKVRGTLFVMFLVGFVMIALPSALYLFLMPSR